MQLFYLQDILILFRGRKFFHSITSGIVITGFGTEDIFPSLKSFLIDGILNGHLMYRAEETININFCQTALIAPFAQREMVHSFMEGIIPEYQELINNSLYILMQEFQENFVDSIDKFDDSEKMIMKSKIKMYTDNIIKEYFKMLYNTRAEYADNVTTVVSHLPKTELALMAKTLVNLTSFKRKVSMEAETVSDPIDVAIISKNDGFIWIERKHYFKPEFNPQFFKNYYRSRRNENEE